MCGIVGRIGPKYDCFNTQVLSHRGPDSNGIYFNEEDQIGLGHTRLAIQDLSDAGHQPMFSNSARLVSELLMYSRLVIESMKKTKTEATERQTARL